jgi:uncharacterized NAD-dependent epimerase/dehydratase family protein
MNKQITSDSLTLTPIARIDGNAIVYCQGAFGTTNGKAAHGLVRRTERYRVLSVVDSRNAGADAGVVLDGHRKGIPIYHDIRTAFAAALSLGIPATHLVMGLAPDGGRLPDSARSDIKTAIELGLHVDSGLHDFISEDSELAALAQKHNVTIRDIRKIPPRSEQHFFTGKIADVHSLKVVIVGTDSAIGKRTTAWLLVDALRAAGFSAEMVGTGQTAWMQGAKYSIILDSIINDFLTGEIEHAIWSAWNDSKPDVIVIEGQGGLLNPAYPGGYEILSAARPGTVIIQHAPARKLFDGFSQFAIPPLEDHIRVAEIIASKPVVAITVNHENLSSAEIEVACREITDSTGRPAVDVLIHGAGKLVEALRPHIKRPQWRKNVMSRNP